ncbi:YvrJ family protein [Pseudalkalibacillus berkeleyi]|uniref:YvrJ family protein n=1 Tax=Pseudalkalibacillus berkeleyi TaxID=1069813 RepID=A0ABS9H1X1_9BACL|nr:YvrJ family protein [Pseudalkalibacillus berkeleyi]MCF6138972.1 YvrJ family protein [Pseudalkalibacillus berkeleyi]
MLEGASVVGWFNLISNIGFPAVVALYLLFQLERRLVSLESTMQEIGDHIEEGNEDEKSRRTRSKRAKK